MRWVVMFAALAGCFGGYAAGCSTSAPAVDAAIDGAIDSPDDICLSCRADQICVAKYDGLCHADVRCVARGVDCPDNVCSTSCEAYCTSAPYQCQTRVPCGGESPRAFTCFGP
jgi:hypothetical protein